MLRIPSSPAADDFTSKDVCRLNCSVGYNLGFGDLNGNLDAYITDLTWILDGVINGVQSIIMTL